jgi:hypothetical protein
MAVLAVGLEMVCERDRGWLNLTHNYSTLKTTFTLQFIFLVQQRLFLFRIEFSVCRKRMYAIKNITKNAQNNSYYSLPVGKLHIRRKKLIRFLACEED